MSSLCGIGSSAKLPVVEGVFADTFMDVIRLHRLIARKELSPDGGALHNCVTPLLRAKATKLITDGDVCGHEDVHLREAAEHTQARPRPARSDLPNVPG